MMTRSAPQQFGCAVRTAGRWRTDRTRSQLRCTSSIDTVALWDTADAVSLPSMMPSLLVCDRDGLTMASPPARSLFHLPLPNFYLHSGGRS